MSKTIDRYCSGEINYRQAKFILSKNFSSDEEIEKYIEDECEKKLDGRKYIIKACSKLLLIWMACFVLGALFRIFYE